MTKKLPIIILLTLFWTACYCQDTIIRIGPSYSTFDNSLKPIFIYDGVPFEKLKDMKFRKTPNIVDSVYVRKDTVFDNSGDIKYYGIIEIYTVKGVHSGLKQILSETDFWLYKNPLSRLQINDKVVKWNKQTKTRLFKLKPENIKDIKIVNPNDCKYQTNGLLILTIDE